MLEWTPSKYGESYTCFLSPTLKISVSWEVQTKSNPSPTPYKAVVFGALLKTRFETVEKAKEVALGFARRQLNIALNKF